MVGRHRSTLTLTMLQVPQGAGKYHGGQQAGATQDVEALAATTSLQEPAESDSEGSMPPIDSGNDSDMEDASSSEE